ncbi:MAG: hypothetical protein SFU56_04115 [Capsulimonadales bacterium]|nr:hypothetical protein [Capsulimonadales bacterium]
MNKDYKDYEERLADLDDPNASPEIDIELHIEICHVRINWPSLIDWLLSLHGLSVSYPLHEDVDLWATPTHQAAVASEGAIPIRILTIYLIDDQEKPKYKQTISGMMDIVRGMPQRRIYIYASRRQIWDAFVSLYQGYIETTIRPKSVSIFDGLVNVVLQ